MQAVIDRVAGLEAQLAGAQQEQKDLNDQANLTKRRLERAGKLTTALGDEGVRWQQSADKLTIDMDLLVGDVFISAACIAYYGAFTGPYRQDLVILWSNQCVELGIPVTPKVTLKGCLASPVEARPPLPVNNQPIHRIAHPNKQQSFFCTRILLDQNIQGVF